ncbi:hypothetical protein FJT64_004748 [Amphibalanus amphitrite]|uniref:Uncharacterized protein n=1 Tax=Amphibalanus amphitrite TaxID=1232801 RepID=A0A6A4VSX9_AMPAM|nr:uncharacterized protein LOC122373873 [Amphibalanus amphitrite]KAF0297886.1 hypothetical protein FJT64_004748 [Amphibalanus amphitrite]
MSVPYSMHAVGKVRENMRKDGGCGAGNTSGSASGKQPASWQTQKPSGLQSYSSKMMKSIWGEYNRYSVHNFKSSQSSGPSAAAGQPGGQPPRAPTGTPGGLFH